MEHDMAAVMAFLQDLDKNNNREWFQAHKADYLRCKAEFEAVAQQVIDGICRFDESVSPMQAKDCAYRIYRDTRFSKDKTPYKVHMGAFIAPQGKKSGFSGYYFQIGAYDHGFPGGCMIAVGDYMCDPKALKILREDIDLDHGQAMLQAIDKAKGFELDFDQALKRVPAPYKADAPYSHLLRLKNFCLVKYPGIDYMLQPGLAERLAADFASAKDFLHLVNRAIDYARTGEE